MSNKCEHLMKMYEEQSVVVGGANSKLKWMCKHCAKQGTHSKRGYSLTLADIRTKLTPHKG